MARLARSVFVRDTKRHRDILLRAGEEPAPEYAALVRNPDAWEDGKLPGDHADDSDQDNGTGSNDDSDDNESTTAPAAKKTAATKRAATKPARGRDAAGEGSSGD